MYPLAVRSRLIGHFPEPARTDNFDAIHFRNLRLLLMPTGDSSERTRFQGTGNIYQRSARRSARWDSARYSSLSLSCQFQSRINTRSTRMLADLRIFIVAAPSCGGDRLEWPGFPGPPAMHDNLYVLPIGGIGLGLQAPSRARDAVGGMPAAEHNTLCISRSTSSGVSPMATHPGKFGTRPGSCQASE